MVAWVRTCAWPRSSSLWFTLGGGEPTEAPSSLPAVHGTYVSGGGSRSARALFAVLCARE
jgi:hypothetical protein